MPQGLPLFKPPYSRMTAIDMNTGEHVWMVASGAGERIRNHPQLKGLNLPALGTPMTYLLDGKQYIALTIQGATQGSMPELIALALP